MFYRSSSRIMLAALIAAALGAFAPTRADDRTSDLEAKLKKKEAEYKELQQQLQSQQATQPDQASQTSQPQLGLPRHPSDPAGPPADLVRHRAETVAGRSIFRASSVADSGGIRSYRSNPRGCRRGPRREG